MTWPPILILEVEDNSFAKFDPIAVKVVLLETVNEAPVKLTVSCNIVPKNELAPLPDVIVLISSNLFNAWFVIVGKVAAVYLLCDKVSPVLNVPLTWYIVRVLPDTDLTYAVAPLVCPVI